MKIQSYRIVLVLALLFFSLQMQAQQSREKAFPFELKDTLGQVVRLEDFKGKTVVMDFWFTGCAGCVQVANMLHNTVMPEFKTDTTVVFVAVSIDINFLQWKKSIRSGIYTSPASINLFTMGAGGDHPLFRHYGFSGCPQMLVIGPDGTILSKVVPASGKDLITLIRSGQQVKSPASAPVIKGTIASVDRYRLADSVTLSKIVANRLFVISAPIVNGSFELHITPDFTPSRRTVSVMTIKFSDHRRAERQDSRNIFTLDPLTVLKVTNTLADAAVVTGKQNQLLARYEALTRPLISKRSALSNDLYEKKVDSAYYKSGMQQISAAWRKLDRQFMQSHPDSYKSLSLLEHALNSYLNREGAEDLNGEGLKALERTYYAMSKEVQEDGKDLLVHMMHAAQKEVIPFTGEMPDGKVLDLASLKGRVFLIDFWGSWCVWCRKGHPHLKQLYEKYKGDGFEIIGVANEMFGGSQEERWKKLKQAIAEDDINWPQILMDPAKQDLAKAYAVTAYPSKFLVDQDGKVLLRVTSDPEGLLDEKLKSLFGY